MCHSLLPPKSRIASIIMALASLAGACANQQPSGSGAAGASASQSDSWHNANGGATEVVRTNSSRASGGTGNQPDGAAASSTGGVRSATSGSTAAGGNTKSSTADSGAFGLGGATTPFGSSSRGGAQTKVDSATRGGATSPSDTTARGGTGSSARGSSSGAPAGGATSTTSSTGGAEGDLCAVGIWDGSTKPVPLSLSGNTFAHDPTMIEADGTFYRFWTGNNIPSAKSTNLASWQDARAVFQNGYSAWVDEWLNGVSGETFNFPWAPDVSRFAGKYHLYSSFSAKFGDNISCITHLSTNDIAAGAWTDHGPVICTKGSENYNAIDADVGIDADGKPWLAFGSFWDGIMGFELAADGSRVGNTLTRLAWANEIEAPVLFYRCGFYYLFVTWGLCCPGEGRSVNQLTYRVVVGRSRNIMGPYLDKSGKSMLDGGGTLMVQGDRTTWAAAGHSDVMVSGNKIYHLYHAYRQSNGEAQLRIVEMPFDSDQWPVPAGP